MQMRHLQNDSPKTKQIAVAVPASVFSTFKRRLLFGTASLSHIGHVLDSRRWGIRFKAARRHEPLGLWAIFYLFIRQLK